MLTAVRLSPTWQFCTLIPDQGGGRCACRAAHRASRPCAGCPLLSSLTKEHPIQVGSNRQDIAPPKKSISVYLLFLYEVNKMERVVHNPVDLMVEVPRPVVIEKTIEATMKS